MSKNTDTEDKIKAVHALGNMAPDESVIARLRSAIANKSNLVAAAGAKTAKKLECKALIPDLLAAYDRFFKNGIKTDKICFAKLAIIDALDELWCTDESVYLKAVACHQMEPSYGGTVDTAIKLRVRGAQALARMNYGETTFICAALLNDPEPEARAGAAKVLEMLGGDEPELLLRMRVMAGDPKPENIGDYFNALITINAQRSLGFIAPYLDSKDLIIAEEAAIAAGASRLGEALPLLAEKFSCTFNQEHQKVLIMAISLLRSDDAAGFLLEIVEQQNVPLAVEAVRALRVYSDRPDVLSRLKEIAVLRADNKINEAVAEMAERKAFALLMQARNQRIAIRPEVW